MQETITLLRNKKILLGVTGSIAAYKIVDLASKLTQAGALVDVIMTDAAQRFVSPLTFQAVTGRPIYTDLWEANETIGLATHIAHVGLAEDADLFLIAPATANTIAKLAHGIADDFISITALAARCPIMIAPAMDGGMYEHPATQENIRILLTRDVILIEPEDGRFASGLIGKGRLPETTSLMGYIRIVLGQSGILSGVNIVVTAGPTFEPIDPVRFISNHSSGKQGYAIAQAGIDAGANVTLISSLTEKAPIIGANMMYVKTAQQLHDTVLVHTDHADALIMAAAVADFRPVSVAEHKIKKLQQSTNAIPLTSNPDILMAVREVRNETGFPRVVVGFAAESQDLVQNAHSKLDRKGLDLLIANDISATDAGFAVENNRVVLLNKNGSPEELELMSKARVGEIIMEKIAALLG